MNIGFQFNYNMPFALSSFYNPAFIAHSRALEDISKVDNSSNVNHFNKTKSKNEEVSFTDKNSVELNVDKYAAKHDEEQRSKRDMSAGELYTSFEQTLLEYVSRTL